MRQSLTIDAHVHIGSWNHAGFLGRTSTLEGTLAEFRRCGIDGAVLMPSDRCENALLREGMKRACAGFEGQLWLFAWVRPPGLGESGTDDLGWVRAHADDVRGLKIHPSLSRRRITDDAFRPALEWAAALDRVVLVHCGRWTEIAGYAHALDMAARYPSVRFILAHAGGDTPENAVGAAEAVKACALDNVWFEMSGVREYWVVERNVALLGAGRYLLGSDFPLAHPRMYLGALEAMDLSEAEKAAIRGQNALELLGPPLSP